jgi:HAD superfamily hydrolase (TIGR01509 family)
MKFKAAIFDMGDIFFDATVWRRGLTEHLRDAGVEIDYPNLCLQWEAKLVAVYLGQRPYWEAFEEYMFDLGLDEQGVAAAIAYARKCAKEIEKRKLFEGVAQTLADLNAAGVKLVVLSDTESSEPRVRARLVELEIEQYFDAVLTSIDIGHVKPTAEAFQRALAAVGMTKDEACFIAHDDDELSGAQAFGITAVAYNYIEGVPADHYLTHFGELKTVVLGE